MTAGIHISFPASERHRDVFVDRVKLRVEELYEDLAVDPSARPPVHCTVADKEAPITLFDQQVMAPLRVGRRGNAISPLVEAESAAERVAAAIIRHRWPVLERQLSPKGTPVRDVLRRASRLGLDLESLVTLDKEHPQNDADLEFAAADRHPRNLVLLLHRRDAARLEKESDALQTAAAQAAAAVGLPFPELTVRSDAAVNERCARLKIGMLRGPVEPDPWEDESLESYLRRPLARAAPVLCDIGAILTMMMDENAVRPESAREALSVVDIPDLAESCRNILSDGFGLIDPYTLCRAILALPVPLAPEDFTNHGVQLLPFYQSAPVYRQTEELAQATTLEQRLRAILVPAQIRRQADMARQNPRLDLGGVHVYWPEPKTLSALENATGPCEDVSRAARAINETLSRRDVLVVPGPLRYKVRRLLRDELPDIPILASHELPTAGVIMGGGIG